MSEKVDTIPHALKCRFCKEKATLGIWMYEADQLEKTFICLDCWNIITSLIEDVLPSMLCSLIEVAEVQMRIKEYKATRHVRVEEKQIEAEAK